MKMEITGFCFSCFLGVLTFLGGCKDTEPPAPKPIADFRYELVNPGKPPARVVFTSESKFAKTHFWRFALDASSSEMSPTFDFNASGVYRVLLTVSNDEGEDTISKTVVLPQLEYQASFSALVPNNLVLPINVRFTDASLGTPIGYFWDFGNGTTSINRNPTATYNAFGDYLVRFIVSFQGGGVDSTRITLKLRQ
jgi:PKD repeat protein